MNFKPAVTAFACASGNPRRQVGSAMKPRIKSNAKTKNLEVELPLFLPKGCDKIEDAICWSVEDMEGHLRDVGTDMNMYISHVTQLGRKRYPGNRHWHFKQNPKETGCLDVTYWPEGQLMWISMRTREPLWVHEAGKELKTRVEATLANAES